VRFVDIAASPPRCVAPAPSPPRLQKESRVKQLWRKKRNLPRGSSL